MRIPPGTLRPLAAPPPCRTTAAAPAAAAAAPSRITNVRGRIMRSPSSDICEGFADGDAGGAGCCCFGGEYRAEDDKYYPDADGEHGDPEGQRRVHEEVAKPGAQDRCERKRRDDRHQAADEGQEDAFGDDDPADSPWGCPDGVQDTELSGPIEDVGAHRRGQAYTADHAHGDG